MINKKEIQLGDLILLNNGCYYLYVYCDSWQTNILIRNGGYYIFSGLQNYNKYLQYTTPYGIRDERLDIHKVFRLPIKYIKTYIDFTNEFYLPVSNIINKAIDITNGVNFTIIDLNNYS